MLHDTVSTMVTHTLSSECSSLKESLFSNSNIVDRLIAISEKNAAMCKEKKGFRLGNMAHVIDMANAIESARKKEDPVVTAALKGRIWTDGKEEEEEEGKEKKTQTRRKKKETNEQQPETIQTKQEKREASKTNDPPE